MRDGRIVEVMEVVGVEGSRVLFERYRPPHDTVLKRYRVAGLVAKGRAQVGVAASSGDWSKRIRDMQYTDHEDYTVGS